MSSEISPRSFLIATVRQSHNPLAERRELLTECPRAVQGASLRTAFIGINGQSTQLENFKETSKFANSVVRTAEFGDLEKMGYRTTVAARALIPEGPRGKLAGWVRIASESLFFAITQFVCPFVSGEPMIKHPDAPEVLDREFLELRAGLLQIAAQLDRLDRAAGSAADDPRMHGIQQAIESLASAEPDRAAQVQLIFSRQYDPNWKETLQIAKR